MNALMTTFCSTRSATPSARERTAVVHGDLCNLLQVVSSALHLIDRQLDDDLRPLVRVSLAAIRQASQHAHPTLPVSVFRIP